ncbi:hypothetical protein SRABI106_02894 [Rahnella aquatilis]|nr:hypothetical protein SRABI106_02894 [Rahnella aquatilis]
MIGFITAGDLLGLLHQRQCAGEIPFAVLDFTGHGRGHNAAVIAFIRQIAQRLSGQFFRLILTSVVDSHLCPQGIKLGRQCLFHHNIMLFHFAFSAGQQHLDFSITVLTLCEPCLQQHQFRILNQPVIRQSGKTFFQQRQLALIKQGPGMLQQNIAQQIGVFGTQRMMNGFGRKTLCQPAFGGSAMNGRQLRCQFPLTTLTQECGKQRVEVKPFAAVIHTVDE